MKTNASHTRKDSTFPVGYHFFHKNKDINFQLNRFYSFGYWAKADAEHAGNAIQEISDWKPVMIGLAEQHKAENRLLAAAFHYRAAELYALPSDPDNSIVRSVYRNVLLVHPREKTRTVFNPFPAGCITCASPYTGK